MSIWAGPGLECVCVCAAGPYSGRPDPPPPPFNLFYISHLSLSLYITGSSLPTCPLGLFYAQRAIYGTGQVITAHHHQYTHRDGPVGPVSGSSVPYRKWDTYARTHTPDEKKGLPPKKDIKTALIAIELLIELNLRFFILFYFFIFSWDDPIGNGWWEGKNLRTRKKRNNKKIKDQVLFSCCCWRWTRWEWGQDWAWFGVDVGGVDPRCSWTLLVNLDRSYIQSVLCVCVCNTQRERERTIKERDWLPLYPTRRLTTRAYWQQNHLISFFFSFWAKIRKKKMAWK